MLLHRNSSSSAGASQLRMGPPLSRNHHACLDTKYTPPPPPVTVHPPPWDPLRRTLLPRRTGSSPRQDDAGGAAPRHHQPKTTRAYPVALPTASTRIPRPLTHLLRTPAPRSPPPHRHGRCGSAPAAATPLCVRAAACRVTCRHLTVQWQGCR